MHSHNQKIIDGICINIKCQALNRRICFTCNTEKLNHKDEHLSRPHIINVD